MNQPTLLIISTLVLASIASTQAQQSKTTVKRYKVKSGIIEFAMTGMQNGKEILYFDDWGRVEAKYTNTEMSVMGVKQKNHTLTILRDGKTYSIQLDEKTGTVTDAPILGELSHAAQSQGKDMSDMGLAMLKQMGGKKVGQEEVAGHMCDVFEVAQMKMKTWVKDGVTLKSEGGFGNMQINSTAIKVQFNVDVPAEKFAVPEDVKLNKVQIPNLN